MRILLVHNFYKQSGGEDSVFNNELNLLLEHGHIVETYIEHNDNIDNISKIKMGIETIWSLSTYKKFRRKLKDFKPDVVHFHNIFPLISPAAYYACKAESIPVVQTLHNYRLLCPAATFLRDGKVCELCLKSSLSNSLKYKCYRDSTIQTFTLASMIKINKEIKTWTNYVDKYIALTDFARDKFIEGGLPKDKITVKPNFVPINELENLNKDKTILFVGRISKEKGLNVLIDSWKRLKDKKDHKLVIVGDGPDLPDMTHEIYSDNTIEYKGSLNKEKVIEIMSKSKYLVVPSVWYEGFPMTILESYSVGTPVIASNIGSLSEVVINEKTGFKFEVNDCEKLLSVLDIAISNKSYSKLSVSTKEHFLRNYTPNTNYSNLKEIYLNLIKGENNEAYFKNA